MHENHADIKEVIRSKRERIVIVPAPGKREPIHGLDAPAFVGKELNLPEPKITYK